MNRDDLTELHYIAPITNVSSIVEHGILSHQQAEGLSHLTVAMPEIQALRAVKRVPPGRPLHEYVNLYICARNPMLYKRKESHTELCVLRISPDVLDLPGAVITDGNAASDYVRFFASPAGLANVDYEEVFAEYWIDADPIKGYHKRFAKCAEVLVPDRVDPHFVIGAYVSCSDARRALKAAAADLEVTIDARLFFR